jgi:phosphomethylpyrimidine synthase
MTQIRETKKGTLTPSLQKIAANERISESSLLELIAAGRVIIPHNPRHANARPVGIGQKLRTKVNVNLGTSADFPELEPELEKLRVSLEYETDTIMDLSTGGDIKAIRRRILKECTVPLEQSRSTRLPWRRSSGAERS